MQFILEKKKKKKLSNSNRVLAPKCIMAIMIIITIVKGSLGL